MLSCDGENFECIFEIYLTNSREKPVAALQSVQDLACDAKIKSKLAHQRDPGVLQDTMTFR